MEDIKGYFAAARHLRPIFPSPAKRVLSRVRLARFDAHCHAAERRGAVDGDPPRQEEIIAPTVVREAIRRIDDTVGAIGPGVGVVKPARKCFRPWASKAGPTPSSPARQLWSKVGRTWDHRLHPFRLVAQRISRDRAGHPRLQRPPPPLPHPVSRVLNYPVRIEGIVPGAIHSRAFPVWHPRRQALNQHIERPGGSVWIRGDRCARFRGFRLQRLRLPGRSTPQHYRDAFYLHQRQISLPRERSKPC